MAKANFKLSEFLSTIKKTELARTNRFEVMFVAPGSINSAPGSINSNDSALVSLFCEISNLPGIAITTKGHRIYGPAYQRPVSLEYGGEAINMTFYVDRDFKVKSFFDKWIFSIVNPNNYNVAYDDNIRKGGKKYTTDIIINQLDQDNNIKYSVKLIEAFPKVITMMDLNMASTNQVHKLNVNFGYRKWVTDYSNSLRIQPEEVLYPITQIATAEAPQTTEEINAQRAVPLLGSVFD
jgi:hypothetical protein